MAARLFVTGASGFVGRRLVPSLLAAGHSVTVLSREEPGARGAAASDPASGTAVAVPGDLGQPAAYAGHLRGIDTVIHLAAATGKVSRERFMEVNVEGTGALLRESRDAGVRNLLFVSSIAVNFPPRRSYHYAQSKRDAEQLVRSSELSFCIVRPTIILGAGSHVLAGLSSIAGLPVMPLIGGGRAEVQPIYVDDLCDFVGLILQRDLFGGGTFELGGPEVLSIGELLGRIRLSNGGRPARTLALPAAPVMGLLSLLEILVGARLPVTAGQLGSFLHDGTIEDNDLYEERRQSLKTVDEMLRLSGEA